MRLIKSSFEILEQGPGLEGIYEAIERAGRTCYKSTRPEGQTAKDFVDRMIASKHYAMLEHSTVYLAIPMTTYAPEAVNTYKYNHYSKVNECHDFIFTDRYGDKVSAWCVTTNLRVLVENDCLEDLEFLCEPTEFHEKRVTVKFTSNIHFYKDITRHRKMSFAIESTRYCNYSKDKFGNELTFILPAWCDTMEEGDYGDMAHPLVKNRGHKDGTFEKFVEHLRNVERYYLYLIECGWKAQEAAEVLPQATKADIIMTGFVSDWDYVFDLRARGITGKPHPEVSRLMEPLMGEFYNKGLLN